MQSGGLFGFFPLKHFSLEGFRCHFFLVYLNSVRAVQVGPNAETDEATDTYADCKDFVEEEVVVGYWSYRGAF